MLAVDEEAGGRSIARPAPAVGAELERKVFWRVVPLLFAIALVSQIDRSNLAFAALQLDADLGFSETVHGLGSGLFFIGYLAQFPAGAACLALGVRRWLTLILTAWSLVAALFSAITNETQFLILRFLLGLTESGTYPAIYYQLSRFYDADGLGVAYTWVATATAVAGLIGAPMAAGLLSFDGAGGLRGWQWLFILEAIPAAVLALTIWVFLPSPQDHGWLNAEERAALAARVLLPEEKNAQLLEERGADPNKGSPTASIQMSKLVVVHERPASGDRDDAPLLPLKESSSSQERPSVQTSKREHQLDSSSSSESTKQSITPEEEEHNTTRAILRVVIRDWRLWYLGSVMFCIDCAMNSVNFWLPQILLASLTPRQANSDAEESDSDDESVHLSRLHATMVAALLSAVPFTVAGVAMVLNAWHSKRHHERRWHTAVPLLVAAIFFALLPVFTQAAHTLGAVVALTLTAAGVWATHGPFFSWPSSFLGPQSASLGFALVKTLGAVGGFLGPLLVGVLADARGGSFTLGALCLAGFTTLASLLVLAFRYKH